MSQAQALNPAPGRFVKLPISQVIPTPDNPRTIREKDPALDELAESIRAQGVLQPVVCRPHPKHPGKYDLRAGHRRLLAAKKAGLEEIPAMVLDLTDEQALEVTVCENLQREDLHPLEEAKGVALLLERFTGQVDAVAKTLGKSKGWVYARAQLQKLTDLWRKGMEDPKSFASLWSVAHLEQIARLAPAAQDAVFKDLKNHWRTEEMTVKDVEKLIASHTRQLGKAPWDLTDSALVPKAGACVDCEKRTSAQPGLFEATAPVKIEEDRCTDSECWEKKGRAFAFIMFIAAKKDHKDAVKIRPCENWEGRYENVEGKKGPYGQTEHEKYEKAKAGEKGARAAVVMEGPSAGASIWVKPRNLGGHSSRPKGKSEKAADPLAGWRERLGRAERKRAARIVEEARAAMEEAETPDPETVITLAAVFGANGTITKPRDWKTFEKILKDEGEQTETLWEGVLDVLLCEFFQTYITTTTDLKALLEDVRIASETVGVDYAAIEAKVHEEIPLPKKPEGKSSRNPPKTAVKKEGKSPKSKGKAVKKRS